MRSCDTSFTLAAKNPLQAVNQHFSSQTILLLVVWAKLNKSFMLFRMQCTCLHQTSHVVPQRWTEWRAEATERRHNSRHSVRFSMVLLCPLQAEPDFSWKPDLQVMFICHRDSSCECLRRWHLIWTSGPIYFHFPWWLILQLLNNFAVDSVQSV